MTQDQSCNEMIIIAICDDDIEVFPKVKADLEKYAADSGQSYDLATFASGQELLNCCLTGKWKPDLILMDIEMPDITGIELSKQIHAFLPDCQIAYHTNYLEYATDIYETAHCYYILKEQFSRRLPFVIQKVMRSKLEATPSPSEKVILEMPGEKIILPLDKILYMERQGKFSYIYLEDSDTIKCSLRIQDLQDKINSVEYVRCHTSFLISLSKVRKYLRHGFEMTNGVLVPISRSYTKPVKEAFARWCSTQL